MNYWWVNQKQTFKQEYEGGYLWSPKHNKNGGFNKYYDNMTKLQAGDVVFSYRAGLVVALGVAQAPAYSSQKPKEYGKAGESWEDDGWRADLDYSLVKKQIRPKDHIEGIAPLLPSKYSPLQSNGNGNQVYLCSISEELATLLLHLTGEELHNIQLLAEDTEQDRNLASRIQRNDHIGETEALQIVKSRKGQGLFKSNVTRIEDCCRVTGANKIAHLIASHIKPWSKSNNRERLDGNNGLLLSPHIDHLFDKGYISFDDNGELLISKVADKSTLKFWHVETKNVGAFTDEQCKYLEYHRQHIFKESL